MGSYDIMFGYLATFFLVKKPHALLN